jgi:putative ABC transport system substrate-binding protein
MRRREFIAGLGSAAAWPVLARAQQPVVPVIGFLSAQSADDNHKNITVPFLQGLKETGYVEGQNVAVEYRWAENQYDRLAALAADLVRRARSSDRSRRHRRSAGGGASGHDHTHRL